MAENSAIEIVILDRMDGDSIMVGFSDGTTATYGIDDLLKLRPVRETPGEDGGVGE